MSTLRDLPSVDRLLNHADSRRLFEQYGRPLTASAFRDVLDGIRAKHTGENAVPNPEQILEAARERLEDWVRPSLRPVINATGVVIHTNLGRSPLSRATILAMESAAQGYSNLEYDLDQGRRGSRYTHAAGLAARLSGAEDALVVNNNAAAVLLVLSALASRRRVLISRTQLVEIGGGFRIPDVMKQSGAKLVEIGTTNRVHLRDYTSALAEQPIRLVLGVHQSNFRIIGFSTEPERAEIAAAAHEHDVPFVEDLGSGTFLDTAAFGLTHEPTVQETIAAGADLVTFSGDKLLGGPQAGIIAGRRDLVTKIKRHPLARAVRADKVTYAGLSATLLHYIKDEALSEIPIWRMIGASEASIRTRAERWAARLTGLFGEGAVEIVAGNSTVGGGSLPGELLPTWLVSIESRSAEKTLAALRRNDPPIIGRVDSGRVLLDPRTVLEEQDRSIENLRSPW